VNSNGLDDITAFRVKRLFRRIRKVHGDLTSDDRTNAESLNAIVENAHGAGEQQLEELLRTGAWKRISEEIRGRRKR
jgi:hypothetical protein